jgi:uncharacterized sporulation protein YeaH/YhbH (DUF444 family)
LIPSPGKAFPPVAHSAFSVSEDIVPTNYSEKEWKMYVMAASFGESPYHALKAT